MVYTAEDAAQQLESDGVSVEIVDLRTVMPWDKAAVLESVRKTSKVLVLHEDTRTGGFGAVTARQVAPAGVEARDAPGRWHRRQGQATAGRQPPGKLLSRRLRGSRKCA